MKVKLSRFAALRNSLFRSLGGIFQAFYVQDTSRCISQRYNDLEERLKPQPFPGWFWRGAAGALSAAAAPLLPPGAGAPGSGTCGSCFSAGFHSTAGQPFGAQVKAPHHPICSCYLPLHPPPAQPFPQAHLQLLLQCPALCWRSSTAGQPQCPQGSRTTLPEIQRKFS